MPTQTLSRIRIYPVKSLDPVELVEAEVGTHSLRDDREFAMLANDGRFVNGKRTGRVNQLKAEYDLKNRLIRLSLRDASDVREFELREGNAALEKYLSDFFGVGITILHRTGGELMDIPGASSVTVVSEASLTSLGQDFPGHDLEDIRLRFRANLEFTGFEAFGEEQLFGAEGTGVRFRVGDVEMIGISPRARCNVPPRDPLTGEPDKGFVRNMMKSRAKTLPANSRLGEYGSLYHLTVNTYIPETEKGKAIRVGDVLTILGQVAVG